ncbi:MAG: glycosyltransferase, partial [Kiritimatiellia bacterium]
IKRFFKLPGERAPDNRATPLHLLYLGRKNPLKGLDVLQVALDQLKGVVPFEFKAVSNTFGEEKEKVWAWCDVLVLPTLSDNFGLVVAEALERGKRVITTDGAPAWGDGNSYGGRLVYLRGYREGSAEERVSLLREAIVGLCARTR